jgi:threonine aldolase
MATRLAEGLTDQGLVPVHPVEANGVFVCPPQQLRDWMLARTGFYPFGDAREAMHRLMCSFDTTTEDVDGFLEHVASFSDGAEEK